MATRVKYTATALAPDVHVLIVDDDRDFRAAVRKMLETGGHSVASATCAKEALDALDSRNIDLVLLDYRLPGLDGLETLNEIRRQYQDVDIVLVTSFGTIPMAVEAIRRGAADYLTKPLDAAQLEKVLISIHNKRQLALENQRLRQLLDERFGLEAIKGSSAAMRTLRNQIRRLADSDAPVLITGESGTGKELVARAIHLSSHRRNGPLVAVNCPGLPPALAESELFGHTKGAFTGADRDRQGLFAAASGGTLFLDEMGDMPLELQAKVLRAIEGGTVRPVGAVQETRIDTRIICATNRDLAAAVAAGTFRRDLYYRINVVNLHAPPLREHPEDIAELARHFMAGKAAGRPRTLSARALRALETYQWPGNVRELKHAIERALALGSAGQLDLEDLPPGIAHAAFAFHPLLKTAPAAGMPLLTLDELEAVAIMKALEATGGDKSHTSRILGINRATLYRKMRKYSLDGTPAAGPARKRARRRN